MNDPEVTVLMTVYNAGRFFEPSIRSILNQTFRNFEFLIVDDGSTDGSANLAELWAGRDSRIRFIRHSENKGQTIRLNEGLGMAKARWIARQDADDFSHSARLALQYQFLGDHSDVVLLGANGRIIDGNDRLTGLLDAPLSQHGITWTAPFLNPFMHTAVIFRADVIRDEFGGYDEEYRIAQDYELWTRVIGKYPSANLPDRLVCYRHLATSMSKAGRERAFTEASRVSKREAERIFGRSLSRREADLIAAFREGLDPTRRRAFWRLYNGLFKGRDAQQDLWRTAATHHLKAAGALSSSSLPMALVEICLALDADFSTTLRWLATRYLNA
ncbi:MAG TPA: glycosyltransferase [Terrimicrobiaceae bacterium]